MVGEVYYRLGDSLFKQKKYADAANSYSNALRISKEKDILLNSLYDLGTCWENLEKWDKAESVFEEFIKKYPDSELLPQVHLKLANALFQQKKYPQAREHYSWVIERSEETELSVKAQYRLGDCWFNEKNYKKAMVEYLRIPILYPQFKEWSFKAQLQVAECYKGLGKINEAKKTYEKIIKNKEFKEEWIKEAEKRLKEL